MGETKFKANHYEYSEAPWNSDQGFVKDVISYLELVEVAKEDLGSNRSKKMLL